MVPIADRRSFRPFAAPVAARMAMRLNWTDAGTRSAVAEYERDVARIFAIDETR